MLRKQVYIEERQERLLKKRAKKLNVPEAELIRRGIDQSLAVTPHRKVDSNLWLKEKKFILSLEKKPVVKKTIGWTREELYER